MSEELLLFISLHQYTATGCSVEKIGEWGNSKNGETHTEAIKRVNTNAEAYQFLRLERQGEEKRR